MEWAETARSVTESIFEGVGHVGGIASSVSFDSPDREARISLTAVGEGIMRDMREKRALTSSDSAENLLEAVPKPPDWDRMSKEEQRVWRNHAKTAKARAVKAEKRILRNELAEQRVAEGGASARSGRAQPALLGRGEAGSQGLPSLGAGTLPSAQEGWGQQWSWQGGPLWQYPVHVQS